jgi:hypothetical protein
MMLTKNGKNFVIENYAATDFDMEEIAHALSMQCRYNGHCADFYSVLTHSDRCSDLVDDLGGSIESVMYAHLHDASEAYLSDVPTPIKNLLPVYKEWEQHIMDQILLGVGGLICEDAPGKWMEGIDYALVHKIDRAMVPYEMRLLFDAEDVKDVFKEIMFLPDFDVSSSYPKDTRDYMSSYETILTQLQTKYRIPVNV